MEEMSMKKMIATMVTVLTIILALGGCAEEEKEYSRDGYYLKLAEEAGSADEVYTIIDEYKANNDETELPIFLEELAEVNDVSQTALICSDEYRNADILIRILKNPKWINMDHYQVREIIRNAICQTDLTESEEMEIAKLDERTYHEGLLQRANVSCEALCYVASKDTTALNLDYFGYRDLFTNQVLEREWSVEEKEDLLDTGNSTIEKALLAS